MMYRWDCMASLTPEQARSDKCLRDQCERMAEDFARDLAVRLDRAILAAARNRLRDPAVSERDLRGRLVRVVRPWQTDETEVLLDGQPLLRVGPMECRRVARGLSYDGGRTRRAT